MSPAYHKPPQPLTVSVQEKGGNLIENHTTFPIVFEIRTETENSQDYAQKPQGDCTFMNSASGHSWAYACRTQLHVCMMYATGCSPAGQSSL